MCTNESPAMPTGKERAIRNGGEQSAAVLDTSHLLDGLGKRTAAGSIIGVGSQVLSVLIQLASVAILARLLTPADYGLLGMALAVTSFAQVFGDLGLSTATIQRKDIDQGLVSLLFYINVAIGILVMLMCWAVAPFAARLLGDPRAGLVTGAVAFAIPLAAFGAQHTALLTRRMEWVKLRSIALTSQLLGAVISVLLAWLTDLGYWALVAGTLASPFTSSVLSWLALPWRPSQIGGWAKAWPSIRFGLHLTGSNLVYWASRKLDNVLIGARWGVLELGHYTRAYTIYMLPIQLLNGPVRSSVIPALSRLQDQPDRWRRLLLDVQSALFIVTCGLSAILISSAELIVRVLLGPGWRLSEEIFQILSLSMPFMAVLNTAGFIQVSLGRGRRMLAWNLVRLPIVVGGFLCGLPFGPKGVAVAVTTIAVVLVVPTLAYASKNTPVSAWMVIRRAILPWLLVAAAVAVSFASGRTFESDILELGFRTGISGGLFGVGAALMIVFDPQCSALKRLLLAHTKT